MSQFHIKHKPFSKREREEREIRRLARSIPDQAALQRVLASAKPALRYAVFERIRPHLSFAAEYCDPDAIEVKPAPAAETALQSGPEPIPDCAVCGLRRASAFPHPCAAGIIQ